MRLSEFSDEDLIEEIKHRGFQADIKVNWYLQEVIECKIGGVEFDISD